MIKRYVQEPGTSEVYRLLRKGGEIVIAKIAYIEVYSAFSRRKRAGDLTEARFKQACRSFERDWPTFLTIGLNDEVLRVSKDLVIRYALRVYDAVHLASAKSLQQRLKSKIVFACADRRLLECAQTERFELLAV